MPTVQRYGGRKVDLAGYPGVRTQAAETAYSEGYGVAEAEARQGEAIGQAGAQAFRFGATEAARAAKEERDRADDVAVLNAVTRTGQWKNQRVYDPDRGALTVKGKDAFGLPEQVGAEYEKVTGEIAASLTTDQQRFAYQKYTAADGLSLDHQIRQHVYGEIQRYEGQELTAFLDNSRNQAILQAGVPVPPGAESSLPRQVRAALEAQEQAIRTHGPRLGLGPEQLQQAIEKTRSETHVGVVQNLLATDQTQSAQAYYDETVAQIDPAQRTRLANALKEGHVRKDAQSQADTILAAGGTLTEQRNKAKAITDPDVRDATLQYLEHENALQEHATGEAERAASKGAYDILDATRGNLHQIPPSTWASFDGGLRSALRGYAEHLARGVPVETDFATYYKLLNKAGDDPAGFVGENLLRYKDTIGESELKQLAGLQLNLKNGNREAALKDLGPAQLQEAVVDDSLTLYGIDPKAKPDSSEGKAIAQLRAMLRNRVETQQALTGKPVADADLRTMTDQILSQSVTVPGSWWNLWPGGQPFFDQQKRLVDMTVADIPAGERTQIEKALKLRGRPISDATVLDLYLETKARTGK